MVREDSSDFFATTADQVKMTETSDQLPFVVV
jgi:hypothetical protein